MTRQHAVVVGGTRGLGLVIVERFLARDFEVTVLSRRCSEKHADNPFVRHVTVDLEQLSAFHELEAAHFAARAPVRYLVFAQRFRGQDDPWNGEIQVGLNATKILIEGLADLFAESGDRAIAAVSSVYAEFVGGSQPVGYHVVKTGLNAMTRYYAWSLGGRGIRMNAVMPLTYVKDESRAFYASQENLANVYRRFVPLQRMGEAADSANVVDYLCSERAAFVTGQSLFVDGGVSVVWPEETARSFSGL
jgi:NAD(P)-dependent dehydrogenase (short-subunit alcohol dehydrogenase family)